jgi:hypothetical protein
MRNYKSTNKKTITLSIDQSAIKQEAMIYAE